MKKVVFISAVQLYIMKKKSGSIVELMSKNSLNQQQEAQTAFKIVISSIRYLCKTGQALQGKTDDEGNLIELLEERAEDNEALKKWLLRRDRWLSHDIQNEITEIMAHQILLNIIKEVRSSPFFGIIADGTTDISGDEQFTFCVRWVDKNSLVSNEKFIGMYQISDTRASTLLKVVSDIILRMGLQTDRLRGHCFDGAPNMSGHLSGLRKLVTDLEQKSIYVHCSNHALDLALQEAARNCELIGDSLATVKDVSNLLTESAKRKALYKDMILSSTYKDGEEVHQQANNLLPLCPTRWCVRVNSIRRFLDNYERIQATLKNLLVNPGALRDDTKTNVKGYLQRLRKFETYVSLKMSEVIFGPCEELARALQSTDYSAFGANKSANMLIVTLEKLRCEDSFQEVYKDAESSSENLDLKPLKERRKRKPPSRFEFCENAAPPAEIDAITKLRKEYFSAIDRIISEIQKRFNQEGMKNLIKLENILIAAANGSQQKLEHLKRELGVYIEDLNVEKLQSQLTLLPSVVKNNNIKTVKDIVDILKRESVTVLNLIDEVVLFIQLLLTVPASTATGERSFSALKRVKTFLRNRMTQNRLSNLLLLHIHKKETAQIPLQGIFEEFASRTVERKATFGKVFAAS